MKEKKFSDLKPGEVFKSMELYFMKTETRNTVYYNSVIIENGEFYFFPDEIVVLIPSKTHLIIEP